MLYKNGQKLYYTTSQSVEATSHECKYVGPLPWDQDSSVISVDDKKLLVVRNTQLQEDRNPIRIGGWVNVFKGEEGFSGHVIHDSKEAADQELEDLEYDPSERLAVIFVQGVEVLPIKPYHRAFFADETKASKKTSL